MAKQSATMDEIELDSDLIFDQEYINQEFSNQINEWKEQNESSDYF